MDKYRRVRKATPPQQNPPASSTSSFASAPASSTATKFTIEQKVQTGAVKKGPYSVKRSVDPNDVIIKRRLGEGSKPLFSRQDICVNRSVSPKKKPLARPSSSDSSSPDDHIRRRASPTKPRPIPKKKTPEKVPYYLDQKREKDRIKRVYGQSRRSRSYSPDRHRRPPVRSRSRTPPSYQRRYRNYSDRRSPSRERFRPRHRTDRSRSRSRSRERKKVSNNNRNEPVDVKQPPVPQTQYIPIPVPVEYSYMHPSWGSPMPMPSQPPRFPYIMRPTMPPPVPYMQRHFRPPRHASNTFQRGNFRPRQY